MGLLNYMQWRRKAAAMTMLGLVIAAVVFAQAPAPRMDRYLGVVVRVDTSTRTLLMKIDNGGEKWITTPPDVEILQVGPGDKDLSRATASTLEGVRTGDRVLVRSAEPSGEVVVAIQVIVIRQSDLAEREKVERAAWTSRGISGRVLAVEPAAGQLTISTFARQASIAVIIKVSGNTVQRRYRPGSARFNDARPSSISDIGVGDQVLALGDRTPDGAVLNAEKLISGSVRYFPATVVSIDPQRQQFAIRLADGRRPAEVRMAPGSAVRRLRSVAGTNSAPTPESSSPINFAELRPRDAVVIATLEDGPQQAPSQLVAIAVVAGVEALLKRAAQEQREVLGSWDLRLDVESADERGGR
jgi:hypothetical protein